MKTINMRARQRRWLLVSTLSLTVHFLVASGAVAEEDHLKGYKIKDLNQIVPPANPYTVTNQFGSESCELKKPQFFLVQSEKNAGNDPRGGPAGDFVCYKAKCTGALPPITDGDSQFGIHSLETKKAKLVCLPFEKHVCGDGNLDPGEACDPPGNTTQCPASLACNSDCTCPPDPCPGGAQVGGFCWYLGGSGASCDATCAGMGQTCDPATVSYAGTGGISANCAAVAAAFGEAFLGDLSSMCGAIGCLGDYSLGQAYRCTELPTTCGASNAIFSRFCACN